MSSRAHLRIGYALGMKLTIDVLLDPHPPHLLYVAGSRAEGDAVQHVHERLVVGGEALSVRG